MKIRALLCGIAASAVLLAAPAVSAATFTTSDGVLSIETPTEGWVQTNDPNYWFAISDGGNTITIDHLSNGENLPSVQVANDNTGGVFQAFVSTKNEVFVIKALAINSADLESLMKTISTIKVLKFDTKTAIQTTPAPQISEFGLREVNAVYYVIADKLNVRATCSTDAPQLGTLSMGDEVNVKGMVTRNNQDYGWYQITFNGTDAYVSAAFLSASKPGSADNKPSDTKEAPKQLADGFTVYDYKGENQGLLRPYSDGLYYSNDMVAYKDNGDGSYYSAAVDETLYEYNPVTQTLDDIYEPKQLADGFTVYDYKGENQGLLRPYSDGLYYSNDMTAYRDNGDGSYYSSAVGETLYEYNPVTQTLDDIYEPEQLADGFTVYDYRGNNQGLLRPYSDGLYYSNDMTAYRDNGDGSYYSSAVGETLYEYNPVSQTQDDVYDEPEQLASGFTVYDRDGQIQGLLRPYSDGMYYSNDMVPYADNGDGTYYSSAVGEILYEYNPVTGNPYDAYESDFE